MMSSEWSASDRDFVLTVLAAFRSAAQDRHAVGDQLLRFMLADTRLEITPEMGALVSKWIDGELSAFALGTLQMAALSEKILQTTAAARTGQDTFSERLQEP